MGPPLSGGILWLLCHFFERSSDSIIIWHMVRRFWDPENKYGEGFIKEYKDWVWEIHYRQPTLGCFIIFSKHHVERFSQLTEPQLASLRDVLKEIEKVYSRIKVFRPDWFNYWQMGNSLPHLHIHGFPRYKKPRFFAGKKWVDKTWGHPPIWSTKDVNHELVVKIRDTIKPYLR